MCKKKLLCFQKYYFIMMHEFVIEMFFVMKSFLADMGEIPNPTAN